MGNTTYAFDDTEILRSRVVVIATSPECTFRATKDDTVSSWTFHPEQSSVRMNGAVVVLHPLDAKSSKQLPSGKFPHTRTLGSLQFSVVGGAALTPYGWVTHPATLLLPISVHQSVTDWCWGPLHKGDYYLQRTLLKGDGSTVPTHTPLGLERVQQLKEATSLARARYVLHSLIKYNGVGSDPFTDDAVQALWDAVALWP